MREGIKRQTLKHLPEELIGEILCNLSVKSLLRFKSVSKLWRSLISSATFVKEHLNRSNSDPDLTHHNLVGTFYDNETGLLSVSSCPLKSLLVEQNQDDVVSTWDHPDRHADYIKIIASCNGLILIASFNDYRDTSLWNPSTGKLKAIPQPDCSQYEPGYDDSTHDYKVVWVTNRSVLGDIEIYHMLIYSVRNDSWKKIDEFEKRFQLSLYCQGPRGTFVNGKVHWLGRLNVKEGWAESKI